MRTETKTETGVASGRSWGGPALGILTGGAEAAGFEPARGCEPSTRLAGGRHKPG